MESIKEICYGFTAIRLDQMDAVKLMDRKEKKYTIHKNHLALILKQIKSEYDILEISGQRLMPYTSVYFDTLDFEMYHHHQNGKLNRYKVRNRTYELTGTKYLEIKYKTNKKRTVKQRIELVNEKDIEKSSLFLREFLPESLQTLEEKLLVSYRRIMLVDKSRRERVTIDINLNCSTFSKSRTYEDLVILEIKHEGNVRDSPLGKLLVEMRLKDMAFSKYCLGIADHFPEVKTNMMKIKMRKLDKALHGKVS